MAALTNLTRDSSPSSRTSSPAPPPRYPPPPSYGAIDTDLEANVVIAKPVKLSSSSAKNVDVAAAEVRMEPAWMAWRRERMQILGPVQQDKRVLLWAWSLLCIFAIVLGVGLGLAYGRKTPADSD
ncbi:hypothetical protein UCDDS831_g03847 [Diplodia seriata]|uniref:Uncharacterized protein n=1 Tax=Diplodia seriata TaxID=420778 RepID=A0A0G2EIG7_9PEZI|nr:hypothetical protein UCDDS831_g03847 [Diplodia seriata]